MKSNSDLVYEILLRGGNMTVGEVAAMLESSNQISLPRNEVAKLVSSLKKAGKIQPVDIRKCSFADKMVIEWSTDMSAKQDPKLLQKAFEEYESLRKRTEAAFENYKMIFQKAHPSDDLDNVIEVDFRAAA